MNMGAEQKYNPGDGDDGGEKHDRVDILLLQMAMTKNKAEMRMVVLEFAISAFMQGVIAGEKIKESKNGD